MAHVERTRQQAANFKLRLAIERGDRIQLLQLLRYGASPHVRDGPAGRTVMDAAAECGRSEMVDLLIKHGADMEARLADGSTSLHLAVRHGHEAAAMELLDARAAVNSRDNSGRTPLHVAVQTQQPDMMQLLLDAGADTEAADRQGLTPLHLASSISQNKPASILLAAGADVAAKCSEGYTALHYACEHRSLAVVRVLLAGRAPVGAVDDEGLTPLDAACSAGFHADTRIIDALITNGAQFTVPDSEGYIPLHVAADENYIKVASCLLRANPGPEHVNAAGPGGSSPLHLACSNGHGRMAALLLGAGADVAARDADGDSPLHVAVSGKHLPVVKQLLAAGADPGAANDDGVSAVRMAAARGYAAILQALLGAVAAGQGASALDDEAGGTTALAQAVENGHTSCVRLLLAAGADPDRPYGAAAVVTTGQSLAGATLLHRAVLRGHAALVPLLATPANMYRVWRGHTPLHLALSRGRHPSMAQALMAAGSPVGVANSDGYTAMNTAARSNVAGIRALLPAMVQGECQRYKQLQQGVIDKQQLLAQVFAWLRQPQQLLEVPAAVLGTVVQAVYSLLKGPAASPTRNSDVCTACIQSVMGVLEGAAASGVMDTVLSLGIVADTQAAAAEADDAAAAAGGRGSGCLQLAQALSRGYSAALQPLLEQRQRLTNRLQRLVTAPCQQAPAAAAAAAAAQQPQQRGRQRAGAAAGKAPQQEVTVKQLAAQTKAAAAALDWKQFVQLWEQLLGQQPALAHRLLSGVAHAQKQARGQLDAAGAMCLALLEGWEAAQQQVAVRKQRELAEVIVGAVQAAVQQQAVAGRGRRRRGGSASG